MSIFFTFGLNRYDLRFQKLSSNKLFKKLQYLVYTLIMNLCEGIGCKILFLSSVLITHIGSIFLFFEFLTCPVRHNLLKNLVEQIVLKNFKI